MPDITSELYYSQVSFDSKGQRLATYVASTAPDKPTVLKFFEYLMHDIQFRDPYSNATVDGPISKHNFFLYTASQAFFILHKEPI